MKTEQIKKLLCVLCLGLAVVSGAVAAAQSEPPSILDRVQKLDDPELGELIGAALETRRNISEEAALEIIRKVTQGYAQIKLLDQQIAEVSRKAESAKPTEVRYELLLAKAELESKRTMEMANLRAVMGVVPRLPSVEQPKVTLNAYISLQMIGERVYVLDGQKPFSEYWAKRRWKSAQFLSQKETLDYIHGRLKDKDSLPIRFHIYYDPVTKSAAEDLRSKIMSLAIEANCHIDTEVRLEEITWVGSGTSTFFVREGKITTFYPVAVQRPDGGPVPLSTGLVNPTDIEQHILWRLTKPKNVPLTFRIEYDEASASLAKQIADTAKAVVKRLAIAELVAVEGVLLEPVPETVFLGRWQASSKGDIQNLDVQPNWVCQVTKGEGMGSIKAGASVRGVWFLTTKEIVIDFHNVSPTGPNYIYRGVLDEEGNLVVTRTMIYPQGSFHESGSSARTITLKRVE